MKTKNVSKILLSLGLAFVLGSAIAQVYGDNPPTFPAVTIHSTGDVTRGKTGSFVLSMNPVSLLGGTYVNVTVSGTAILGVDYVPIVSPLHIGPSGYGVILVKTLPDSRGSFSPQSYSVVVTLEPGPGYAVGTPKSAQMMIKPSAHLSQHQIDD
jgi:hypothetical protein